ncbi:hypothetical protein [Paenibacillus sp. Z3-2]
MFSEIQSSQDIKYEHLACFRSELLEGNINSQLERFLKMLETNGYQARGPLISVTFNQRVVDKEIFLDIEYLVPIDRAFAEQTSIYKYKPLFHLTNALKFTVSQPDIESIKKACADLSNYIEDTGLQQITYFYNVTYLHGKDKNELDIYVGINPSSL